MAFCKRLYTLILSINTSTFLWKHFPATWQCLCLAAMEDYSITGFVRWCVMNKHYYFLQYWPITFNIICSFVCSFPPPLSLSPAFFPLSVSGGGDGAVMRVKVLVVVVVVYVCVIQYLLLTEHTLHMWLFLSFVCLFSFSNSNTFVFERGFRNLPTTEFLLYLTLCKALLRSAILLFCD